MARKTATGPTKADPVKKLPAVEDAAKDGRIFFQCTNEIKKLARTLKEQCHELSLIEIQDRQLVLRYLDLQQAEEARILIQNFGEFLSESFPGDVDEYLERQRQRNHLRALYEPKKAPGISELLDSSKLKPEEKKAVLGPDPISLPVRVKNGVFSFVGAYVPAAFVTWIDEISATATDSYSAEQTFEELLRRFTETFNKVKPMLIPNDFNKDHRTRQKLQDVHKGLNTLADLLLIGASTTKPIEVRFQKDENGNHVVSIAGFEKSGADRRALAAFALLRSRTRFKPEDFANTYSGNDNKASQVFYNRKHEIPELDGRIIEDGKGYWRFSGVTFCGDLDEEFLRGLARP